MDPVDVPAVLATMSPGPALGAVLAGLDLARVANEHTVTVLQAQARQVAHEQARLLESIVEVGRSTPFSDPEDPHVRALLGVARSRAVQEWASGEIAAALTLTATAADRELAFADAVVTRLPLVLAALSAGAIDRPKAWVFAEYLTTDLTTEQAAAICAALVPVASRLTTGQLRARLARLIHDIDPDHARRRYQRAVRGRAVVGYLSSDGTVTITASGLPADEAAVACERLDMLAEVVQRAGHRGRLDQIKADLFLGLLEGTFHHLTQAQIVAMMLGRVRPEDTEPGGRPPADDRPPPDADAGADSTAGRPAAAADNAATGSDAAGSESVGACGPAGAAGGVEPANSVLSGPSDAAVRAGVEIRVGLCTLIGIDERCGEIPGLGPVLPGIARRLVAAQHLGAQWRFAVVDAAGDLVVAGTTRHRPTTPAAERGRCREGVVEVHVSVEDLARLATDPPLCGPWAAVVADVSSRYAERDDRLTRLDRRPADRFARAALARHVEIRDRTCCFPGCRRPARRCDKDHTRDHALRGSTTRANVGALCERHHRYKTGGGWVLAQPEPGRFHWTSPLGQRYRTRGESISPPTVASHPRPPESDPDSGAGRHVDGPILRRPPPRPTPPRRPPPENADDPPPF